MAGLSRASLIHDAECGAALAILNSSESPDDCPEHHPSMSFLALAWLDELQRTRYLNARLQVPRSKTWVHHVLPELDDLRFRAWVRMDRRTFAFVHDLIVKHSIFGSSAKSPQAPVADQLAIALHKFGTNGTGSAIRLAAGHWGQSEGHIINCTRRVAIAITDILKDWIKWPGVEERVKESRNAMERSGIKGVIGKVDATDIVLNERPEDMWQAEDGYDVSEAELELNELEDVDRNEPAGGDGRRREVQRAMLERLGY
ncbi:hypothetical protein CF326_g3347 [Tilletia indica]|nr:hypothetical protein CF326_g3347 [Tilletia indica]